MLAGDGGLGIMIVDASGKLVARVAAGPERVRMLAPGYSLRRGLKGEAYRPERAAQRFEKYAARHPGVAGDWTYGDRASYAISGDEGMFGWDKYGGRSQYTVGDAGLPMKAVAQDALRSSSLRGDEGMFGWDKYGGHAQYNVSGLGAGLPMKKLANYAVDSSTAASLAGDEGMFGPEGGEQSDLF